MFMLLCVLAVALLWFYFNKYCVLQEQLKDQKALESKYKKLKDSYILLHRNFKSIEKEPTTDEEKEQKQKPVTPFDLVNGLMEGKYEIDDEFK